MKRFLTAAVLLPIVVALVWYGPSWLLFIGLLPFLLVALWEFCQLGKRVGLGANQALLLGAGVSVVWFGRWQPPLVPVVVVTAGFILLLWETLARTSRNEALPAAAGGFLGLLYVAVPFAFLLDLRTEPAGNKLVLLVLVMVWAGDIAAYYVGRALGRHKLAPRISPAKTVEGGAASFIATVAAGFWLISKSGWFPDASLRHAVVLPVVVNLAAQVGDLVESALKRGAGVKDSSSILPGHGGMLDRIDSLLLAVPALWYYYIWFVF